MTADFPVEATAFLGAVAACLILLVVFYLYLNRMLCFHTVGDLACCGNLSDSGEPRSKDLESDYYQLLEKDEEQWLDIPGSAFAYNEPDSSSDSDDEVLKRLQHSASATNAKQLHKSNSMKSSKKDAPKNSVGRSPSQNHTTHSKKSSKHGDPSGNPSQSGVPVTHDLISLAEKGHVGKTGSGGSSGLSDTSGPDTPCDEDDRRPTRSGSLSHKPVGKRSSVPYENRGYRKSDSSAASEHGYSACGDSVVGQDDHLFDVSDLQSGYGEQEANLISKCGGLEVSFMYEQATSKMSVHVLQARDIPTKDRGGANSVQVRLLLLPAKKQKNKTKIRQTDCPEFNENFSFSRINPEEVSSMGIRFRLYGCERMRRERLIGESVVSFASLNLEQETTAWLTLEPRSNLAHSDSKTDVSSLARSDSTGSTQSMQHGGMPELLVGLAYNGTTGRLAVEVIKGSHFRNLAMTRAPDTYVKLSMMSSNGQELSRSKTSIRRGQPNPLFKETFMFQVALFQLPDVTLMISVYNKRSMKRKEMIGWFSLGLNSSGEEEMCHWRDMRENKGEQVCRWHVLLES